jgi:hypothetical protein
MYRPDQRKETIKSFDKDGQRQRLPVGPLPADISIPNNSEDVKAYLKRIALPKTAEDDHIGNSNAKFILV